jgi:hypothetical protein
MTVTNVAAKDPQTGVGGASRPRHHCLAALATVSVLVLGTVACTPDSSAVSHSAKPAEASADVANSSTSTNEVDELQALVEIVALSVTERVATCMSAAGWSQITEASKLNVTTPPGTPTREPLRIHHLEIGPASVEEAEEYGLLGVEYAFQEPEVGGVLSKNDEYDEALNACRSEPQVAETIAALSEAVALNNEILRAFRDEAWPSLEPLLVKQLQCLASSGWAIGDPSRWLEGSLRDTLATVGVEPGTLDEHMPASNPDDLEAGEVLVVAPKQPTTYTPSESELEFAYAWVSCAETGGFVDALESAQQPARDATIDQYREQARSLITRLEDSLGSA